MKKTITVFALLLSVFAGVAQNKMFGDGYLKHLQKSEEKSELFVVQTLSKKDIKEYITSFESNDNHTESEWKEYRKGKALFERAEKVIFIMDAEEENLLSPTQIDSLLQSYEELASMEIEETTMRIKGLMKKDKVKELVFIAQVENEAVFFVDLIFKKPVALEECLENPADISRLFSFNAPEGEEDNALFRFSSKKSYNYNIPPTLSNKLHIVKENDMYGVITYLNDGEKFIVSPEYSKEIVLYGSNPGNTYVKTFSNERDDYLLRDKYGFLLSTGDDISPIYVPDSDEVAFFIIKRNDQYLLYECPEKYELLPDDNGHTFRPHVKYRFTDCRFISQKDEYTLECVKADGNMEELGIKN